MAAEPVPLLRDPAAEFVKFVMTQWVAAFVTYEVIVGSLDPKGRLLPTLGL
jgi:hypothetical protein